MTTMTFIGRTATPCCNRKVGNRLTGLRSLGDHTEFACPTCGKAWIVTADRARSDVANSLGATMRYDWDGGRGTALTPSVKPTPRRGRR